MGYSHMFCGLDLNKLLRVAKSTWQFVMQRVPRPSFASCRSDRRFRRKCAVANAISREALKLLPTAASCRPADRRQRVKHSSQRNRI